VTPLENPLTFYKHVERRKPLRAAERDGTQDLAWKLLSWFEGVLKMKKFMTAGLLVLFLGAGMEHVALAQQSTSTDEAKKAGEAAKKSGKDAADAAKHAGKATAKATEKAAKKTKKAVTGDAHATCVDGTVQAGKTEAAAASGCSTHGGVAKK